VLLPGATSIIEADARLSERLTPENVEAVVAAVPEAWADAPRYVDYLRRRLRTPRTFAEEAERERLAK